MATATATMTRATEEWLGKWMVVLVLGWMLWPAWPRMALVGIVVVMLAVCGILVLWLQAQWASAHPTPWTPPPKRDPTQPKTLPELSNEWALHLRDTCPPTNAPDKPA